MKKAPSVDQKIQRVEVSTAMLPAKFLQNILTLHEKGKKS